MQTSERSEPSAVAMAAPHPASAMDVARQFGQSYGPLTALILLAIFNALFTRNFLTEQTLRVNLTQVATIVIVATGMTLVIATGGIDLSVGAIMAIAGNIAPFIFLSDRAPFNTPALGLALAFVLPVMAGAVCGLFNGTLVTGFRLQPIIATLVLFLAGRGIAQIMTDGALKEFRHPEFQYIGKGEILGVRFQVIMMLIIVGVVAWAMRSTTFGRYVLAIGGNEAASRLAGVPVNRIKLAVYIISGTLAGLAGLVAIAINSSSDPNNVGQLMELDAIAAVAVGGTPLTGGRASIGGTLVGALIIQLLRYTLLSHGIADATARIVIAISIVAAVLLQRTRQT